MSTTTPRALGVGLGEGFGHGEHGAAGDAEFEQGGDEVLAGVGGEERFEPQL